MKLNEITTDNVFATFKPSQWVNIGWIIIPVIPAYLNFNMYFTICLCILCYWKMIVIYCWKYEFGERTITEKKGVFNVTINEIHYFRIKSVQVEKPFFMRIFGLSNIILTTSDPSNPVMRLYAMPKGDEIHGAIKRMIFEWRNTYGIKEIDVPNT